MLARHALRRLVTALVFAVALTATAPALAAVEDLHFRFEGDTGCVLGASVQDCARPVAATPAGVGPFARITQSAKFEFAEESNLYRMDYTVVQRGPDGTDRTLVACASSPGGKLAPVTVPLPYRGNGRYSIRVAGWRQFVPNQGAPTAPTCSNPSFSNIPSTEGSADYEMKAVPPAPALRGSLFTHGDGVGRGTTIAIGPDKDALNRFETTAVALPGNPTAAGPLVGYNNTVRITAPGRYELRQRPVGYFRVSEIGPIDAPGPWGDPTTVTVQSRFELTTADISAQKRGRYTLYWHLATPEIGAEALGAKIGDCGKRLSCKPTALKHLTSLGTVTPNADRNLVLRRLALKPGTTYGIQLSYAGRPWVPAGTITQTIRARRSSPKGTSPLFIVPLTASSFAAAPTK